MTRQEAIKILNTSDYLWLRPTEDEFEALNMAIDALEQEPMRGKWIDRASELDADFGRHDYVCSKCFERATYYVGGSIDWWDRQQPNFCPNCGARMESEDEYCSFAEKKEE